MAKAKAAKHVSINPVVAGLSAVLSDHYLLALKTKNYHWNVRGPLFASLHPLFDEQYAGLIEASDDLAERIRALGERSPGSFVDFATVASVCENTAQLDAIAQVSDLAASTEVVLKGVFAAREAADAAKDEGTADLLTNRERALMKNLWMLRSIAE